MTKRDIIEVQLESFWGTKFPQKIQKLVDEELNNGTWVDGYELAVSNDVISGDDASKLLSIILKNNSALFIDPILLTKAIDKHLPQGTLAPISWIIDDTGDYALTDSLRVARFHKDTVLWSSPRISYDGIDFDFIADDKLRGKAWLLGSHETPTSPFTFDFGSGELLEGTIIEP